MRLKRANFGSKYAFSITGKFFCNFAVFKVFLKTSKKFSFFSDTRFDPRRGSSSRGASHQPFPSPPKFPASEWDPPPGTGELSGDALFPTKLLLRFNLCHKALQNNKGKEVSPAWRVRLGLERLG